jgi:hypothetical protein
MSKQFIFVNADGFNEESEGAYEISDFISTSAGASDAGKPIVLDGDGQIDASMINDGDIDHTLISNIGTNSHADIDTHIADTSIHFTEASIDHGSISGLSDDDHTQYILADGTRDFSGVVEYASHPSFTIGTQLVDKQYVDDTVAGVGYTVGAGGVDKGDLVYISGNDTILPYATLTDGESAIGLALSTVAAAGSVIVAANDTIVEDVLTAATAGTPYYWTGSALSITMPSGAGAYVWQAGVAKNATDLHVEVRQVKRNSP